MNDNYPVPSAGRGRAPEHTFAHGQWRIRTFLLAMVGLLLGLSARAQTTLIDPSGDGGFSNGATFEANGWSVSNSTNNPWYVGTPTNTVAAPFSGAHAYISNDSGTTNAYSTGSPSVNYFWRDVTVPAGESKIALSLDWISNGNDTDYDIWQVFAVPVTTTPSAAATFPGRGNTVAPAALTGAAYVGHGALQTTVQSASFYLPGSLAGTTFRLVFAWKNDTSGGTQRPAALDNISLVSSTPGSYTSIASGNWGDASTWAGGIVPSAADDATILEAHAVTINAAGQGALNLVVNGALDYASAPTTFTVMGNMTVGPNGQVNVYNGTTGKTLSVGGNLTVNGTLDVSVGATTAGTLIFNGAMPQTITAADGSLVGNKIRNLIFANSSTAIPNIEWNVSEISVEYNLDITNAKIDLNDHTLTYGTGATTSGNTFSFTNGGFLPDGIFARWWSSSQTGYTTSSASSVPTSSAGRYPFYTASGQQRVFYLGAASPTAGRVYAVRFTPDGTLTGDLDIDDNGYVITDRWNDQFAVTTPGFDSTGAASYRVSIFAPDAFLVASANARVMGYDTALGGTHVAFSSNQSFAQRSGLSYEDLTTETGLYMGINQGDILMTTVASGNWENAAIWSKGFVPECAENVVIQPGHTVTVNATSNVSRNLTISTGATLVMAGGDLTVGCENNNNAFVNNGTLTVNGGELFVNGSLLNASGSTFNQSAGLVKVDGNSGSAATSVGSIAMVRFNSQNLNLTGGTFQIVDPHASTSGYNTLNYDNGNHVNLPATHTFLFGDGESTDAGGYASYGFRINTWVGSGRLSFGKLVVDLPEGTNRQVTTVYGFGINGDFTIAQGRFTDSGSRVTVAGNIVNDGEYISTSTTGLYLGTLLSGTDGTAPAQQTISGSGMWANSATTPTAELVNLTVNNAVGVHIEVPMTLSGTLNLINGYVDNSEPLRAASVTGGSPTAYVKGILARAIANANSGAVLFPVGKTAYAPVWITPTTTEASVFQVEHFTTNSGVADASIINLSADKRWEVTLLEGNYNTINVKLGSASITEEQIPVMAPTANGTYTSAFGSLATFAAGTPNTVQSLNPVAAANFSGFLSVAESNACSGAPAPGNTIASTTAACYGQSITFSLQNETTGTGVTYQWEKSTNGVDFEAIDGATASTLTLLPTADAHYRAQVTCGGTETTASNPVLIAFSNSVTSTTPATRCGVGEVTLSATGSNGTTIRWYETALGGSAIAEGNSFVTTLNESKDFYASAVVAAPISAELGEGGTTSSDAGRTFFPGSWGGAKTQYIIRASELIDAGFSAGSISSLGFEPTASGQTYQGFFVKMGLTNELSAPTTTFIANGLSLVYAGTEANNGFTPVANEVNTLTFGTGQGTAETFEWDGVSNIVVSISWSRVPSASTSTASAMKVDNVGFAAAAYRQRDSKTPAELMDETSVNTTSTFRPRFLLNGEAVCASPRVAVAATVNTAPAFALEQTQTTICAGADSEAFNIAEGAADYDTFVWEPAAGVSGDATEGWVITASETTTFTLTASNSTTDCAVQVEVTVSVNANPAAPVVTGDADICASETTQLVSASAFSAVSGTGTTASATTSTGAALGPNPVQNYYGGTKQQWLYRAEELTALGFVSGAQIQSFSLDLATAAPAYALSNLTVKMKNTAKTAYASTSDWETGLTTVKTYPTYSTQVGANTIMLDTPFTWDGTSSLVIEMNYSNNNGGSSTANNTARYSATTFDSTLFYRDDNKEAAVIDAFTGAASYKYANRNNVTFAVVVPGLTTWSPATGLYTDAAATVAYVEGTNATTVYAKPTQTTAYTITRTLETGCTATSPLIVTVNPLVTPDFAELAPICSGSTAPVLATTSPNGISGTWTPAVVDTTTGGTYTFLPDAGQCATTQVLNVSVVPALNLVITSPAAVCAPATVDITADAVTAGSDAGLTLSYWADPNGTVTFPSPDAIPSSGTFYIKAENESGCSVILPVVVTVNATQGPAGDSPQDFTGGETLADFEVEGENIIWYDAAEGGNVLPSTTPIVSGVTYHASQTINGCESIARLAVTAGEDLDVPTHGAVRFAYYPNPVVDHLTISLSENIRSVEVVNLLGQRVMARQFDAMQVSLDMSGLAAGSYIVNVASDNVTKTVKVIKN